MLHQRIICRLFRKPFLFFFCSLSLGAQQTTPPADPKLLQQILDRLSTLEEQNRLLVEEVRSLREQLHPPAEPPSAAEVQQSSVPLKERVAVNESRIDEQAQTKVESSQKFPLRFTGMLLFNAFENSHYDADESPNDYGLQAGPANAGATFRQTLLGLQFDGPHLPGGGRVSGDLMMDFWSGDPAPGGSWIRLRQANVSFAWNNATFSVGQDRPLISPYAPDSLAEVGIPPLAGAGNLWYWLPQARYEQRFHLGPDTTIHADAALLQTKEAYAAPPEYPVATEAARPAVEGRIALTHNFDDVRKFEIGTGYHAGETHADGSTVDSRIASVDWLAVAGRHLQVSGTFFHGENVAGLGSLTNGFTFDPAGHILPVHSTGGWSQLSVPITARLSLNIFAGLEDDRGVYAAPGTVWRNFTYASNLIYHLGPNVVVGFEGLQVRTSELGAQRESHEHYDLAIGYLF